MGCVSLEYIGGSASKDAGLRRSLALPLELRPGEKKSVRLMVTSSARGLTGDELQCIERNGFHLMRWISESSIWKQSSQKARRSPSPTRS